MRPTRRGRAATRLAAAAFACLACAPGCGPGESGPAPAPLPELRLRAQGVRLLDALGREVWLRGVNAGNRSKLAPFVPFAFRESGLPEQAGAPPFADAAREFFARVQAWGHDAVRLPFSWEGLEPSPGRWDEEYLERYLALIDAAAAQGLRVIVDFHQDVYASPFCGDGFPPWTLPPPVPPPPEDCQGWFLRTLDDPDIEAAFDRFWADQGGVRTAFEAMWRRLAAEAWARPGVVAFEVINEPLPGSAREADWAPDVLTPFYSRLAALLGEVAPGALVVFDAGAASSATATTSLERPAGEGLVFAPHYYDASVFMLDQWSQADLGGPLGRLRALGDGWQVPVLLGEFGARARCQGGDDFLRAMYAELDARGLHATVWEASQDVLDWNQEDYSLVDPNGLERPWAAEVVRVYPAAVAGRLVSFGYDPESRAARLTYTAEVGGLTELAAPSRLFPRGLRVTLDGAPARQAYHPEVGRLVIEALGEGELRVEVDPL
ncbi:MAG TPA: cellulase family glycosylhydrolase [Myxococcota bacterium]|nr:cellulase family glycosylhydrolase [Myxococcota bacterium]HRY95452.1 cellulase family glycosylhydrolase [Myxococcota bacterium]